MDITKESKLSMFLVLIQWIDANMQKLEHIPGFMAIFDLFKSDAGRIAEIRPGQEESKKGIAQSKTQAKEGLAVKLNSVSRKAIAFAVITLNLPLQEALRYTLTELRRAPDTTLSSIARLIIEKIAPIQKELEPYGISADDISNLSVLLATYDELIPMPREGQIEKKDATLQISNLFDKCDGNLVKMDALTEVIHDTDPQTYNDYWDARKVIKTAIRTMALKANATEKGKGIPVANVVFEITNTATGEKITKKTAAKGNFYLKNLMEGSYEVKIKKSGYLPQTRTIEPTPGEMYLLKVELEKE